MEFFTHFTREKTPQKNFSSQNFNVENNFQYHLSGVVEDLLGIHFLPMGKLNIHPFLRAGGTQAKSTKDGLIGLCVLTAISEKGGCFIWLWVKYDPLVGPQQSQISGIESSFFLADWHFQWCVWWPLLTTIKKVPIELRAVPILSGDMW